MIFSEMALQGRWILLAVLVLLLCSVLYNFTRNIVRLCYKPVRMAPSRQKTDYKLLLPLLLLLGAALVLGLLRPEWMTLWIRQAAEFANHTV